MEEDEESTPNPTSSERRAPRISGPGDLRSMWMEESPDRNDLMDADSLKSSRSTGAGNSFAGSLSTPTTCDEPSLSSKGLDIVKPGPETTDYPKVVPTDPPPPPPPTKAILEPPRKRVLAVLAGMLLAGIILWRIWPWVSPHFGR